MGEIMSYIIRNSTDIVEINQKRDIYEIHLKCFKVPLNSSLLPYVISLYEPNIWWSTMKIIRKYIKYTPVIETSTSPIYSSNCELTIGINLFSKNEVYIKYIPDPRRRPLSYNEWVKSGYKLILTLEEFRTLPESCKPQDFFQALDEGTRYYFNKIKFLTFSGDPDILFRFS